MTKEQILKIEKLRETIEIQVKDTIGYSESINKDSFMIGVSVTFNKMKAYYDNEIKNITSERDILRDGYENTINDIKLFTSILNKYSSEKD